MFGFQTLLAFEEGDRFVFLGFGEETVLTLWEQGRVAYNALGAGVHHLSFQVESLEQVREVEETVRSLGAEMMPVKHAEGMASGGIYFRDPDGLRLEVFAAAGLEDAGTVGDGPACGLFSAA